VTLVCAGLFVRRSWSPDDKANVAAWLAGNFCGWPESPPAFHEIIMGSQTAQKTYSGRNRCAIRHRLYHPGWGAFDIVAQHDGAMAVDNSSASHFHGRENRQEPG